MYCGGEVLVQPGSSIGICTCCMAENPLPKDEKINRLYEKKQTIGNPCKIRKYPVVENKCQ